MYQQTWTKITTRLLTKNTEDLFAAFITKQRTFYLHFLFLLVSDKVFNPFIERSVNYAYNLNIGINSKIRMIP